MVQRHDEAHRADAKAFGSRAAGDSVERRRRHPAFVRTEMMLDAEAVVEAEVVTELKLAPELLVALVRGHVGLAPDMGEVGKFHGGIIPMVRCSYSAGDYRRPGFPSRGGSFSMPA